MPLVKEKVQRIHASHPSKSMRPILTKVQNRTSITCKQILPIEECPIRSLQSYVTCMYYLVKLFFLDSTTNLLHPNISIHFLNTSLYTLFWSRLGEFVSDNQSYLGRQSFLYSHDLNE